MASLTLVNRNEGAMGSYRMLTGGVKSVSDGNYLTTGYTNVYSVQLTPWSAGNASFGVYCSGGGTITFKTVGTDNFFVSILCD